MKNKQITKCYLRRLASEIRTPEIRTPEIRTPEIRTLEIRTPEIRTPEIRTYVIWAIYKVLTIQSTDGQNTKIKKY